MTFKVEFHTNMGEHVILVGSAPELGQWNTNRGVRMHTTEVDFPIWSTPPISLSLPDHGPVLYKYVLKRADGRDEWESGPDRRIERADFADIMEQDVSIEDVASIDVPVMQRSPSQIKLSSTSAACRSRLISTCLALLIVAAMVHAASLLLRNQGANAAETIQKASEEFTSGFWHNLNAIMQTIHREFMIPVFNLKMHVMDAVPESWRLLLVLASCFAGAAVGAKYVTKEQTNNW